MSNYLQIAEPNLQEYNDEETQLSKFRSVRKLRELAYDPIEKMVQLYERLVDEEALWARVRSGIETTLITGDDGKIRSIRYSAVAHAAVLAQMNKVNSDLLRYGYGRVPETVNFDTPALPPMFIQLVEEGEDEQNPFT